MPELGSWWKDWPLFGRDNPDQTADQFDTLSWLLIWGWLVYAARCALPKMPSLTTLVYLEKLLPQWFVLLLTRRPGTRIKWQSMHMIHTHLILQSIRACLSCILDHDHGLLFHLQEYSNSLPSCTRGQPKLFNKRNAAGVNQCQWIFRCKSDMKLGEHSEHKTSTCSGRMVAWTGHEHKNPLGCLQGKGLCFKHLLGAPASILTLAVTQRDLRQASDWHGEDGSCSVRQARLLLLLVMLNQCCERPQTLCLYRPRTLCLERRLILHTKALPFCLLAVLLLLPWATTLSHCKMIQLTSATLTQ